MNVWSSPLFKPLRFFTLTHIFASALVAVVSFLFEIEGGSGVTLAVVVMAAGGAGAKFVQTEKRVLAKNEFWRLTLLSTLISSLLQLSILLLFMLVLGLLDGALIESVIYLIDLVLQVPLFVLVLSLGAGVLMTILACALGYGPITRSIYKKMLKQNAASAVNEGG